MCWNSISFYEPGDHLRTPTELKWEHNWALFITFGEYFDLHWQSTVREVLRNIVHTIIWYYIKQVYIKREVIAEWNLFPEKTAHFVPLIFIVKLNELHVSVVTFQNVTALKYGILLMHPSHCIKCQFMIHECATRKSRNSVITWIWGVLIMRWVGVDQNCLNLSTCQTSRLPWMLCIIVSSVIDYGLCWWFLGNSGLKTLMTLWLVKYRTLN